MLIGLNGEGFEAALIDGTRACCLMLDMPALRMGHGDPAEDFRELSILAWPEEEVPVIGHEAIGGDANAKGSVGFRQNGLKGHVIGRGFKQWESAHPTVQNMIGEVAGSKARTTWHRESCIRLIIGLSRKETRPHNKSRKVESCF